MTEPFDAEVERLREALSAAQGEAYLGTLAGDDVPSPVQACHNVIAVCLDALPSSYCPECGAPLTERGTCSVNSAHGKRR